ncbi:MAG: penicillin-binding protein activator LpoB [Spirochaetaceae bacterium]|jgi:hypothetical protein|nr:penicillin-binding protein activator LpoB [Spirochaetaceae bacterium]
MRNYTLILPVLLSLGFFAGCASGPRVTYVDGGSQRDLSGRWNAANVRTVCDTLIAGCLGSPRVDAFVENFRRGHGGRLPAVVIGEFTNATSEHIDTGIIVRQMELAIDSSGKLQFAAGGAVLDSLRTERQGQLGWASEESALALANETGANLMLTGTIRSIVDRAGGRQNSSYFVSAELWDIESRIRLWIGEDSSINKQIEYPSYRP